MKRFSAAARISLALVCLTATLLLLGQSFGLVPDANHAVLAGRTQLCQSIAIACSQAAQKNDTVAIRSMALALMSCNKDILSVAVRHADGKLLTATDGHESSWKPAGAGVSTPTQVQVPIFKDSIPWGTVEIRFRALPGTGGIGWLNQPALRLTLFVALTGFVLYLLYLRRTLRMLDPSAVIPDRVKAMLETLAEGVLVLDAHERIVLANNAFAATVGRSPQSLQGLEASTLKWTLPHSEARPDEFPWLLAIRTGQLQRGTTLSLHGGPEGSRAVTINCAPILGGDQKARGVLVTVDDVTVIEAKNGQLKEMLGMLQRSRDEIDRQNKELHAAATTDPLTGCRNRRAFYKDFQTAWSDARRHQHNLAVMMVDVDHFKKVNDVHGHSVGDTVLQHVAAILLGLARDTDVVARYGGEEFCILLPHCDAEQAALAAERYRLEIASKPCGAVNLTASFGCSAMHLKAETPALMLDQADKALYAAKRTGRNRTMRFDRMPSAVEPQQADTREFHEPRHSRTPDPTEREGAATPIAFHAVTALMSALAHRDKSTADHSRRVADFCVSAGRGLLSLRDCFVLEVAAMLHDVGKLGVPDAILHKAGPLTEEEWLIMQQHDRMGMEITAAAFGSNELTRIIRTHHAFFSGNARDSALPSGHDIPIEARILSIADAFDAMTSHRPYRRQRSAEEAFAELRSCAGKQFDPELVEHFIKAVRHSVRDPIQAADEDFMNQFTHALQADEVVTDANDAHGLAKSLSTGGRRIIAGPLADEQEQLDFGTVPTTPLENQMSQQKYLRLRLEIERLACSIDTGDVASLAAMAVILCDSARDEGLKEIANRAEILERSARLSDTRAIIHTVNELLRLCDSAQKLDEGLSENLRRRFAWQTPPQPLAVPADTEGSEGAAPTTVRRAIPPAERIRRWGMMFPPKPVAPISPAESATTEPATGSVTPGPVTPARRIVRSPFAVEPLTAIVADGPATPAAEADPTRPLRLVRVRGASPAAASLFND